MIYLYALADPQIIDLLPAYRAIIAYRFALRYNKCKAFIMIYLYALADTQITDLLPAYRAIIAYRFALCYNIVQNRSNDVK